jgi:hypothetical protein
MQQHRWHPVPIALVAVGVAAVVAAAIVNHAALGWWQAMIYAGGAVALAAVFWFRRQLSQTEIELETLRKRLADEELRLTSQHAQIAELRLSVEQELAQQTQRLDKREAALADRLVAYHEWMEFPQPVDLAQPIAPAAAKAADDELAELARKDRELMELLKGQTRQLYDNILANKYAQEGKLKLVVIRDDLHLLVTRVARIYQPGIEQPLLEASLARIARGGSRACLQLLVVLDELPLGVKDASLSTLYTYVRNAVKAWQMYKTSEPYWPFVNSAWYLGRFAMGANPFTLGAWWFVSSLSQQGAKALATHLVNRQALALLGNLVRVIGYEVAGIYGGDFRHRDANWIYAAELSELLVQFPLSRDSLAHGLREIGALELRSEYDRVFLYRCLAGHASARPQQYRAVAALTTEERHAVAGRLEKFLETFVHGKSADRVTKWKQAAEERLGVKMAVALQPAAVSVRQQIDDAARSLASFLISNRQLEADEIRVPLAASRILGELPPEGRAELLQRLVADPPFFFEHPDLDPDGDLADVYLDDLAHLHARTTPRDAQTEETLCDVAAYLRRDRKEMQALIEKNYATALAERLAAGAPARKFPAAAARAALDLVEPGETAQFLYPGVTFDWPEDAREGKFDKASLWLLGAGNRLVVFAAGREPKVLWRGDASAVHAEQSRNLLMTSCRITGGQWLSGGAAPLAIRIPTGLVSTYTAWFGPLLGKLHGTSHFASASASGSSTLADG